MSQNTPIDYTIPENLEFPEFTSKKETDKILKLLSSGVLRTHSDTFNSLDASYLNNLPGPKVEVTQTFEELYNKFLTKTNITSSIQVTKEIISNWESDLLKVFTDHLNENKMYLIDEIIPKISTITPKLIKENEPLNIRYKKYYECVFTKTFYIDSVKKLELKNSVNIDIRTLLVLANILKSYNNEIMIEDYLRSLTDTTTLHTLEISPKISINGNVPIPNEELYKLLKEQRNIEKTLILYQDFIFNATAQEKAYIKDFSEPKMLEDFKNINENLIENEKYPLASDRNLEALFILFGNLKTFWLYDTEISGKNQEIAKSEIFKDLVIKDTIELKPKFKDQ